MCATQPALATTDPNYVGADNGPNVKGPIVVISTERKGPIDRVTDKRHSPKA
jgi:hypothetical protein